MTAKKASRKRKDSADRDSEINFETAVERLENFRFMLRATRGADQASSRAALRIQNTIRDAIPSSTIPTAPSRTSTPACAPLTIAEFGSPKHTEQAAAGCAMSRPTPQARIAIGR